MTPTPPPAREPDTAAMEWQINPQGDRIFCTSEGRALLVLQCGRYNGRGECHIPLNIHGPRNGAVKNWGWDGVVETPTVTPSISCDVCKLHLTITKGARS